MKINKENLRKSIKRILMEEIEEARLSDLLRIKGDNSDLHKHIEKEISKEFKVDRELPTQLTLQKRYNNNKKIKVYFEWYDNLKHNLKKRIQDRTNFKSISEFTEAFKYAINYILPDQLGVNISENGKYAITLEESGVTMILSINLNSFDNNEIYVNIITILPKGQVDKKNIINFFVV